MSMVSVMAGLAARWCGRLGDRDGSTMPCESCAVQFSVFKRKRACCECERYYCSSCLRRGGGTMCAPCRVLSTRPLSRNSIAHLKVRDLQCFLQRQNISTRGCVEKEELVSLCVTHVNSSSYRRRGQRTGAGTGTGGSTFSSLKGLTSNFNEFINSAFDLRSPSHPAPPPPAPARGYSSNCFNSAHAHSSPQSQPAANNAAPTTTAPQRNPNRFFTTTPGGERDIRVPVPEVSPSVSRSTSGERDESRVDTADCFEIEDLDEAGWEFVNRPADPLPQDSTEIIIPVPSEGGARRTLEPPGDLPPARAASELDLNIHEVSHASNADNADSSSLQDEPIVQHRTEPQEEERPRPVTLETLTREAQLEALSVRQLKELLARSRVDYRACLERAELLQRARTLWRDHQRYREAAELDTLPLEECCKICMSAPLECVLLECGHIAACTRCAAQLAECPICRQYVVRPVRFFRS